MNFIESIRANARANPMRLILPEGTEPRTLQANRYYTAEFFAQVKKALTDNGIADDRTSPDVHVIADNAVLYLRKRRNYDIIANAGGRHNTHTGSDITTPPAH